MDRWMNFQLNYLPIFHFVRTTIGTLKKNCYDQSKLISTQRNIATLLGQPLRSDISGITGCTSLQSRVYYHSSKSIQQRFFRKDFGMGWIVGWIFNRIHPFSTLFGQQPELWKRTATISQTHLGSKKHRYVMKLLDQLLRGDISGI